MIPAPNPWHTNIIGAPADGSMPECGSVEATVAIDGDGLRFIATAWEPTEAELAALARGEKVWLYIWTNGGLPPAGMSVGERPFFAE